MYQDAFEKLDKLESENALKEINPVLDGAAFDSKSVTVLGHDLSFYPGYKFLDVADYQATPHLRKHIIYKPGDVYVLDGTRFPFEALNEKVPVCITEFTVDDYLRFYLNHVRGPDGRFVIIEGVDDIPWKDEPPPAARKAVGDMVMPVSIAGYDKARKRFDLTAYVLFNAALFQIQAHVSATGDVDVTNHDLLAGDMPVMDDALGQ